jgi:hypothetical protein
LTVEDMSANQPLGVVAVLVAPSTIFCPASWKMMVGSPTALTSVSISWADWELRVASALLTAAVWAGLATESNDCSSANCRSCAVVNASSPPKSSSATGPVTLLLGEPLPPASSSALAMSAP